MGRRTGKPRAARWEGGALDRHLDESWKKKPARGTPKRLARSWRDERRKVG